MNAQQNTTTENTTETPDISEMVLDIRESISALLCSYADDEHIECAATDLDEALEALGFSLDEDESNADDIVIRLAALNDKERETLAIALEDIERRVSFLARLGRVCKTARRVEAACHKSANGDGRKKLVALDGKAYDLNNPADMLQASLRLAEKATVAAE